MRGASDELWQYELGECLYVTDTRLHCTENQSSLDTHYTNDATKLLSPWSQPRSQGLLSSRPPGPREEKTKRRKTLGTRLGQRLGRIIHLDFKYFSSSLLVIRVNLLQP